MIEESLDGSGVTPAYANSPQTEPSAIQEFYKGKTIFVTGATGFLGKLTLEKLLRSCPDLHKVYIVVRPKKGKDVETRRKEMFDCEIFDVLKRERKNFEEKVEIVPGDLTEPNLGLSEEHIKKMISEVNVVFHIAATVRFDEKLRTAVAINIKATRDLLKMAKQMQQLQAFVHVSTAYSHCPRTDVDEEFYEPPISADRMIQVVDALDDDMLEGVLPTLLGRWPNTYVLTKAVAEDLVKNESKGLPLAVVRPSIVTSTYEGPIAGWIDNLYGATGVIIGAGIGLIRSLHCHPNKLADIVPADYVINCIISAAWDTASNGNHEESRTDSENEDSKTPSDRKGPVIYNYISCQENPITWGRFMALTYEHAIKIPSKMCVWYYFFTLNPNLFIHTLYIFFLHTIPAHIVDFGAKCVGRKPMLVQGYTKIHKFLRVISYFASQQWNFSNKNTQALWQKLNYTDRREFPFSMKRLNWTEYFYTYLRGARVYLLKDPMETIPEGEAWYRKLKIAHYVLVTLFSLLLLKLCVVLLKLIANRIGLVV